MTSDQLLVERVNCFIANGVPLSEDETLQRTLARVWSSAD